MQKKTGEKLHDTGLGNDFMDPIPKTQAIKAKTDKQKCIQLKGSAQQRKQQKEETIYKMGENICKLHI